VKVVISTDAHSSTHFKMMKYGVITARRGWLEKKDVINTLGTAEFLAALRPRPGAVSAPTAAPSKAAKKKSA
jgi:histidinol phosphatase-like PHP family hydrolase